MSEQAMTVEIDEAIRRDPQLLRDVEAATAYLLALPQRVEPPHVVRWRRPDLAVAPTVLELDDGAGLDPVRASIPRPVLQDRPGRESAVRWAWLDLLEQRSEVAHSRVERTMAELEAGGVDGW